MLTRRFILPGMNIFAGWRSPRPLLAALAFSAALTGCVSKELTGHDAAESAETRALRTQVGTIVVIYAENRAFDNLYGNYPGAHGLGSLRPS